MYSYSQQTRCFRNSCNVAWPCRPEPTSDRTVLTTVVCIIGSTVIKLPDMHSNTIHTVSSIVSFLIENIVTVRSSKYKSHLKDAQTLWVRLPACGQGCQLGFFKPNSRNLFFFLILLASQNSFGFLAFSWRFYMLKLSARKLHIILFLNHFL